MTRIMSNTTDTFEIVYRPQDWVRHDAEERSRRLQQLSKSAAIAEQRNLEKSAERFRPSRALLNAINAALAARVPLLLTGEPGTGKTQVAWFLKRFFDIPLFAYQVHSNSQANDLRYDFDAVAYLRDAYLARKQDPESPPQPDQPTHKDPRSQRKYLKPGSLWKAYRPELWPDADQPKKECVLLIDEIDKAPRDFPNDLLQELDQHRFAHPFHSDESDEPEYIERAGAPPIIIITSNGERRLPDAFLRRCIVHHIELDNALLKEIMAAWEDAWGNSFPKQDAAIRQLALQHFQAIRQNSRLSKRPGAAELLLWLSVLAARGATLEDLQVDKLGDLPALECLIKDHADHALLAQ